MLGETREEPVEITAGELPGERLGDSLVAFLKGDEAFAQNLEIRQVVRSEDLALNHREVDLDLVEPGGMSGKVDEPQVGPRSLKAFHRSLAPMRRAVVHYPEHPLGGGVGLLSHHLIDQPTEGLNAVLRFPAPEELRPMHVPGCQVSQRPFSFVLVLHAHKPSLVGRQGQLAAMASLNGGLLVGRDDVLLGTERLTLPLTLVEVQHPPGFMREVGVAGEDPRAMVEGTDGFFAEPPPDGGARDLGHEAPRNHLPSHFRRAPATQGDPATSRKLASQRLHLYPPEGGKGRRPARAWSILQST